MAAKKDSTPIETEPSVQIPVELEHLFRICVDACFNNPDFMREYRRLSGHAMGLDKRSALDRMIDKATRYEAPAFSDDEAKSFFEFVRDYVFTPFLTGGLNRVQG
jgi:hypothetical protein